MPPHHSRLSRSVIPSLASVAIHALLALALLGITIERFTSPPPRPARLSLEATAPAPPSPAADRPEPRDTPPAADTPPPDQATTVPAPARRAATDAARTLQSRTARPAPPPAPPVRTPPALPEPATAPPAAAFAGVQANAATRIVFAVDASGAMVTSFSFIQAELARAIDRLQPTQSFQVVLFAERTGDAPEPWRTIPHTGDDDDLIRASAANRILARRWVNAALPGGRSNPVEGLTRALDFKPDLVFLLARGIQRTGAIPDPADQRAVLDTLDTLNPTDPRTGLRPAVIKTIEFIEPDPTGLIEQIARLHGDGAGSHRLITPETPPDDQPDPRTDATVDAGSESATTPPDARALTAIDNAQRTLARIHAELAALLASVATPDERARAADAAAEAFATLADLPPPTRRTADPRPHLLRARAALALAAVETHPPRRTDLAMQALADLTPLRIADPATDAARDTLAARARLVLNQPETAHESLLALLRTADPTDPNLTDTGRAALLTAIAEARLALLDAATAIGPATPEAARARDATAKALDAPAFPDHASRARAAAALVRANLAAGTPDPLAPLTDLYTDPRLPPDTRRALAAPRLAALAGDTPPSDLPLGALRALADHASWPPPDHARAADLLESLSARTTDADERAAALRDATTHAHAAGLTDRARTLAFTFASTFPDHPDAPAILTLITENAPAPVLARALATDPDHPLADDWRLALARDTDPDAALDLLAQITRPSPATAALALQRIDEALAQNPAPERRAELLARAATEAARLGDDLDPDRRLLLARTLATTDPDAAERTLAALPPDRRASARADRVRLDAALTRAEADLPDAPLRLFETAREIADRRAPDDGELYWHSVTLWLELGAARGGPDARAAARAHIAALRQSHPDLGGEPWRARLNALAE